jgi:hypothetical protein
VVANLKRPMTMDEFGEIELVFVTVARCIGTVDLAELALEAGCQDVVRFNGADLPDVPVTLCIDKGKQIGKGVTVLETHPAAVANLENSLDFLFEPPSVPIFLLLGIVREPFGGLI